SITLPKSATESATTVANPDQLTQPSPSHGPARRIVHNVRAPNAFSGCATSDCHGAGSSLRIPARHGHGCLLKDRSQGRRMERNEFPMGGVFVFMRRLALVGLILLAAFGPSGRGGSATVSP